METYNAFIYCLREKMKSEGSIDELKSLLKEQLPELKTDQDKSNLLREIEKLRRNPNIDRHYIGRIQDFFNYAIFRLFEGNDGSKIKKDWSELFRGLYGKYIKDVSQEDFNEIMNYRRLPNGKGKGIWVGSKADAVRFSDNFHFDIPEFNECFLQRDGKKIDVHNRPKTAPKKVFNDLLIRHKQQ